MCLCVSCSLSPWYTVYFLLVYMKNFILNLCYPVSFDTVIKCQSTNLTELEKALVPILHLFYTFAMTIDSPEGKGVTLLSP